MTAQAHELATKSALIRSALVAHQPWIEEHLGVPLADVVIFDGLKNLSQIGLDKVFDIADLKASPSPERRRFRTLVASAHTPPAYPPVLTLMHTSADGEALETLLGGTCRTARGRTAPLSTRHGS